jgi:redox-sensitive bicupin YhaK (pirin superfamily)
METWDIRSLDVKPHEPQVLDSEAEGRTIVLQLPAGEQLQEHQVHERAWLIVVDGEVSITTPDGGNVGAGAGTLAVFDPAERHEVTAKADSRLLLLLGPWPGEGHPSREA